MASRDGNTIAFAAPVGSVNVTVWASGTVIQGADRVEPTVTVISPAEGPISASATIVVDVSDNVALVYVTVFAIVGGSSVPEVVYRGGEFVDGYSTSTVDAISGGYRFHIARRAGWPAGTVSIEVDVVDSSGNVGA